MRNHFVDYPLGAHMLLILVLAVIVGALFHGKRLPKSKLYITWFVIGVYLYFSMWLGAALGNAPAPLWFSDANWVNWKDYLVIPLVFIATSLVVEDRKAIRTVILITAITILFIDRSCILESRLHSWASFDESKRDEGPLMGINTTAAYLADFAMFTWGFLQFIKAKKYKLLGYGLVAATLYSLMYTFSRGAYLAFLVGILLLGILKDRKLLVILGVFLLTWQTVVPTAVHERVSMTENANGQLETSAQERIDLWKEARDSFVHSPILGNGFATYQYSLHVVAKLEDTHNWFVKVIVETGLVGLCIYLVLLAQMLASATRLFRRGGDPLYRGLGLGLILAVCSCLVTNCFGDRWTYLEISGPLWVLMAACVRANQLTLAPNQHPDPHHFNEHLPVKSSGRFECKV
jgi:putative inorganic carbon (hco3(-)) transporter